MTNFSSFQGVELNDTDFEKISRLVYDQCGICLTEGKKELVKARLGKRLRSGDFRSFRDYYRHVVQDESGRELIGLLDSIATNFTSFFRERQHFDFIRSEFLPELIATKKAKPRKLRFWSAGCSSGEEPHSIAITLLEALGETRDWDAMVLATDLSTKVLRMAEAGVYAKEKTESLPSPWLKKYFLRGEGPWEGQVRAKDAVKRLIRFQRLNLMDPFHFSEPFDCIFCRNVMIYFDKKTQADLVNRFYQCLGKGGVLVIGHSESLTGISHLFSYVKPTIYKRT
jgi:chemotaxis protein methyltransferase CheR